MHSPRRSLPRGPWRKIDLSDVGSYILLGKRPDGNRRPEFVHTTGTIECVQQSSAMSSPRDHIFEIVHSADRKESAIRSETAVVARPTQRHHCLTQLRRIDRGHRRSATVAARRAIP